MSPDPGHCCFLGELVKMGDADRVPQHSAFQSFFGHTCTEPSLRSAVHLLSGSQDVKAGVILDLLGASSMAKRDGWAEEVPLLLHPCLPPPTSPLHLTLLTTPNTATSSPSSSDPASGSSPFSTCGRASLPVSSPRRWVSPRLPWVRGAGPCDLLGSLKVTPPPRHLLHLPCQTLSKCAGKLILERDKLSETLTACLLYTSPSPRD